MTEITIPQEEEEETVTEPQEETEDEEPVVITEPGSLRWRIMPIFTQSSRRWRTQPERAW